MHFIGHATVRLDIGGQRVLTDPVLLSRVTGLQRVSAPCDPRLYAGIDVAVISHLHHDHLDLRSLRLLGSDVLLVVPLGAGRWLRGRVDCRVAEIGVGDRLDVGELRITATKAVHDDFRPPLGPRADAVGYLLESEDRRVYFAGDTDLFPEMGALSGGLDVALLPVWGWGPRLGKGHLNPVRAGAATALLRPQTAVPIHWGTLRPFGAGPWMRRQLVDPPKDFARAVDERRLPVRVAITEPGAEVAVW